MATPKQVKPLTGEAPCAHNQCGHPLNQHHGYGCNERILTVFDTEGNCSCVGFTTDPEDSWRNRRDYQGLVPFCVPCDHAAGLHAYDDLMRGTVCAVCGPFNCLGLVTQAEIDKADREYKPCSRCGDDPNYCVCTTGWDPIRGMVW